MLKLMNDDRSASTNFWSRTLWGVAGGLALLAVGGCKDLTQDPGLPSGTTDPAFYNSLQGALGMRVAAIFDLNLAVPEYLSISGLLTDELVDRSIGSRSNSSGYTIPDPADERLLPEGVQAYYGEDGITTYGLLQNVRAASNTARNALVTYDTLASNATTQHQMRAELYAVEAYAEILLSELFCSGVPLSTLDYKQDFTYKPSSTSAQVHMDAMAKLDSGLALAAGNDSVLNLIRVLRGRAQLQLGNYAAAADDVSGVPTSFQYRLSFQVQNGLSDLTLGIGGLNQRGTVSDREGGTGLPFLTSGDPRTATIVTCTPPANGCSVTPLTMPAKYFTQLSSAGFTTFVLANGIEARLIEAEASFQASPSSGQWLTTLNQLRAGTFTIDTAKVAADTLVDTLGYSGCTSQGACDPTGLPTSIDFSSYVLLNSVSYFPEDGDDPSLPINAICRAFNDNRQYACNATNINTYGTNFVPAIPLHVDSTWHAGTGGIDGLAPLTDPGTGAARISLLFKERAYWLFMTGHRQGDLRRLIRQYGGQYPQFRAQQSVYPTGIYNAPGTGRYGTDINMPIPQSEYANPNYHGCLDRNA